MATTTVVVPVDRSDTQVYPDAQVFADYRRRGDYAFVGEPAPHRRALDFYMPMLGADGDTVRALVRRCTNKVAPVLSVASLIRLGLPRELAHTSIASVKKLRGVLPCQEWHGVVVAASRPDSMSPAARLRLNRAYLVSVQASVGAVAAAAAGSAVLPSDFADCGNPIFVYLLHLLAHAHLKLAAALLDKSRSRPHEAARYLHRTLSLARCLYGPMSPRISSVLSSWHDVNQAIGPQRDPQVAWWHTSIVADWFQRIQVRHSPLERDARLHIGFAPWIEWAPARASNQRRARVAERAQRRAVRVWWRQTVAAVVSRRDDHAVPFDWTTLVVSRLFFHTERCRHAFRLVARLDASLRAAEHARMRVLARHPLYAWPFVDVASLNLRVTHARMTRGILRLQQRPPSVRRARAAVGDLRASYEELCGLARQPGGAIFDVVCSLAAVTVAFMEALHLLDAQRQLAAVAIAARRMTKLLVAHKYPTCDAWKVRVLARSSAALWLARLRHVDARQVPDFRRHTASAAATVETSRRVDPRVAVDSFILKSFAEKLTAYRRLESFVFPD